MQPSRRLPLLLLLILSAVAVVPGVSVGQSLPECSDGFDNDDDGETDYPDDAACETPEDDHEELPRPISTCRASSVRVEQLELEPVVANKQGRPCVDESAELIPGAVVVPEVVPGTGVGPVVVFGPFASTFEQGFIGGGAVLAGADASVADIGINMPGTSFDLLEIGIPVANAFALAFCTFPTSADMALGSSIVTGVTIFDGPTVAIPPGHQHIAVPGMGTLHLNERIETATSLTLRAVWLDSSNPLLSDVVLGEVVVGCF